MTVATITRQYSLKEIYSNCSCRQMFYKHIYLATVRVLTLISETIYGTLEYYQVNPLWEPETIRILSGKSIMGT